jgi:hypothetical protein
VTSDLTDLQSEIADLLGRQPVPVNPPKLIPFVPPTPAMSRDEVTRATAAIADYLGAGSDLSAQVEPTARLQRDVNEFLSRRRG